MKALSIRTTDNNDIKLLPEKLSRKISDAELNSLYKISNRSVSDILKENKNTLLFPQSFIGCKDKIEEDHIFTLYEENNIPVIKTQNIMGFIGFNNNIEIQISSRFCKNGDDYLLHYMLQKAMHLNLFDFKTSTKSDNIWNFLFYLFPFYLNNALNQGLFKKYKHNKYNDPNIRGPVNIAHHIKSNTPFLGKIAYSMREHTYDNDITQLIRHTIEFIKSKELGKMILNNNPQIKENIRLVTDATPSYNKHERHKILARNIRAINHPYFLKYRLLQKLCIQILRHEKLTYGSENDKVYGILFDGAWLWETYLNSLLKEFFEHPDNMSRVGGYKFFVDINTKKDTYEIYPDFISKDKTAIADAKYKPLNNRGFSELRNDYFQLMAYMMRFTSKKGFLIYPNATANKATEYIVKDTDCSISVLGLDIPQHYQNFNDFKKQMYYSEKTLTSYILKTTN